MKNVILDLLLAIELFALVWEVNSSPMNYGEGSSSHPYRINDDENKIILDYMGIDIHVIRKSFPGNVHVPIRCYYLEIEGYPKLHGIPDIETKRNFNFTTVPLYSLVDGIRYCVIYIKDGGELLGVQIPPNEYIADPKKYKGDPKTLSPDESKYYLTYDGSDFEVHHEKGNQLLLTDVKLFPENKPNEKFQDKRIISTYKIRVVKIECAGISFFAARRYKIPQYTLLANIFVVFEAAWLHPESIAPLLQDVMTEEERRAWLPEKLIGESSREQPLKKAKKKHTPKKAANELPPAPPSIEDHIVVWAMGIYIDVIRRLLPGDNYEPVSCNVRQENGYPVIYGIPNKHTKQYCNFTTHPVFYGPVRYCVLYLTDNWLVLGVKIPPSEDDSLPSRYRGDPEMLSPDASTYFLTYFGWDFVVYHEDGNSLNLKDIKLYPKNKENNQLIASYVYKYAISGVKINCAGIQFFAARRHRQSRPNPIVFDNHYIMFEAAWLYSKDIPDVIPIFLTEAEIIERYAEPKIRRPR